MSETRDLIISNMIGNPEKAADAFIDLQKEFTLQKKQLEQKAKSIDELVEALDEAKNRIKDMLTGDDAQAWKEAEKFIDRLDGRKG